MSDPLLEIERTVIEMQMRRSPTFRLMVRWYMVMRDLRYVLWEWPLDRPVWDCTDPEKPVLRHARTRQELNPSDPRYEEEIF